MGRVKLQPRRNLRVIVKKYAVRPFPRQRIGRQELRQYVQRLAAPGTVFDFGAIAALHTAAQAHLDEHAELTRLSAFCGRRTILTRRDWMLAGRIRGMRTQ